MENIRVYLAYREVLFREGIHFALSREEGIEVVGETTSNEQAMSVLEDFAPAVAFLDFDHHTSGIVATRSIKQRLPSVSIILVLDSEDDEQLFSALKSGASAYITIDSQPDPLVKLVQEVAKGARPISRALLRPALAKRVLSEFHDTPLAGGETGDVPARLTSVEEEILHHASEGTPPEQLAALLNTSEEDINLQLDLIRDKLIARETRKEDLEAEVQPQVREQPEGARSATIKEVPAVTPEVKLLAAPAPTQALPQIERKDEEAPPNPALQGKALLTDFLRRRGYQISESAQVTGRSGAVHTLDILATRDDTLIQHQVAIGILVAWPGQSAVGLDQLLPLATTTLDTDIPNWMVMAIPRFTPETQRFAQEQGIKVLTPEDLASLALTSDPSA